MLAQTPVAPDVLPLAFARQLAPKLAVVFHQSQDTPLAYSVPWAGLPQAEGVSTGPTDANVTPRYGTVFLHASYLDGEGRLRPFHDLPVDAAEQLFHALLELHLATLWPPGPDVDTHPGGLSSAPGNEAVQQQIHSRAEALLPDLPAATRREAYLSALADFGSHLLSMANEVERLFARRGQRLCAAVDVRHTLFGLWNHAFRDGRYSGRFYQPAPTAPVATTPATPEATGGPPIPGGRWIETAPLSAADKRLLVESILRAPWVGQARPDLAARHCPP